jgi:hypothetical protein
MKGSKRNLWLKQGMKKSLKKVKKITNRKARRLKNLIQHNEYRKLAKKECWKYIP